MSLSGGHSLRSSPVHHGNEPEQRPTTAHFQILILMVIAVGIIRIYYVDLWPLSSLDPIRFHRGQVVCIYKSVVIYKQIVIIWIGAIYGTTSMPSEWEGVTFGEPFDNPSFYICMYV